MDLSGMLNKLREEVREMVRQEIANAIEYTKYSVSSETGTGDKVSGRKGEGSEYDNEAQRIQHFGFRSRPPKDTPAIRLSVGSVSNSVIIGEDAVDRYGAQDLDDGDTAIYSAQVEKGMHLDGDGQNNINSKDGQKVMLQGGGKGVARLDDTTACGWLLITPGVGGVSPTVIAYTSPSGTAPVPAGPQFVITLTGKIDSASSKTETG